MFCYTRKQPIATGVWHALGMYENLPINEVLASNLAFYMAETGIVSQPALAARSGISQRTISNYLHPTRRAAGSRGKPGSAKLTELERIAKALGVEVWQLLRPGSPQELRAWGQLEEAFKQLAMPPSAQPQPPTSIQLHENGPAAGRASRVTT